MHNYLYNCYSGDAGNIDIDSNASPLFEITYYEPGNYMFNCTVTDSKSLSDSGTAGVDVIQRMYYLIYRLLVHYIIFALNLLLIAPIVVASGDVVLADMDPTDSINPKGVINCTATDDKPLLDSGFSLIAVK